MDLKITGQIGCDLPTHAARKSSESEAMTAFAVEGASILSHDPQANPGSNPDTAGDIAVSPRPGCEATRQTAFRSEAESRSKTVANNVKVPTLESITEADRKAAAEAVKKADPTEDTIFTGVKRGNFALFHIRARSKDLVQIPGAKTGEKMRKVVKEQLVFLPGVVSGTLSDYVAYFASKYADGDEGAGTTRFKDRAFNAELVALRAKMKSTPAGGGKRRGKGHI